MDTEAYWEARPVVVDGLFLWTLFHHHTAGGQKFRDNHGHFSSLEVLQDAIKHIESTPVKFTAKGTV